MRATTTELKTLNERATAAEAKWFCDSLRTPRRRTLREFAEEEIVLPNGPFEGRRFRVDRQPFVGLLYDAIDSEQWNRACITGPTQTGKTLAAFVVVVLYYLFEWGESVVVGIPDLDMSGDKWREDIEPVIQRTKYRDLIPRTGAGSKGGRVKSLKFRNGATLRFMSGTGADKSRAGFTARILVITETDGMDAAKTTSREAPPVDQLEGRLRAFGHRKRVVMECTVSIEAGRTWQELLAGTDSKIYTRCPHCRHYVHLGREDLHGWQEAETEIEARRESAFYCNACGEEWSEEDRRQANLDAVLVHRGQEIDAETGEITGEPAAVTTLGFRWDAVNNMFLTAGDIGQDEWKAARSSNEDAAERKMRQFVWALPAMPATIENPPIDPEQLRRRFGGYPKGEVPVETQHLTMGIDIGKRVGHWLLAAWWEAATGHVVDYGTFPIPGDAMAVDTAIAYALREFRQRIEVGWLRADGRRAVPWQVWIDSRYQRTDPQRSKSVFQFCREAGPRYRPTIGLGASQAAGIYKPPKDTTKTIVQIGDEYYVEVIAAERLHRITLNSDYWKSYVRARLTAPPAGPGAVTFYAGSANEHRTIVKHLLAEESHQEWFPEKGWVDVWRAVRKTNHYLDTFALASAAAHFCGIRLTSETPPPATETAATRPRGSQFVTPSGEPFFITERSYS